MARPSKPGPVRPLRVLLFVALGIAVLGGTFVAGFRVGQLVPAEVMPFFDSHTATADEPVQIVAPAPADAPSSASERPSVAAPSAASEPVPPAAGASEGAATGATARVVERQAPASARTLSRGNEAPSERRAVYVSAGDE